MLMPVYRSLPITFERGQGLWLWDQAGDRYLDAIGGMAVCVLGHAHPAVTTAIQNQASKLLHTSNLYTSPLQEQLATKLAELAQQTDFRAFFCNSFKFPVFCLKN
jgi:acetylornithine aminotransferase